LRRGFGVIAGSCSFAVVATVAIVIVFVVAAAVAIARFQG
jgi:hypothetical protein